MRKALLVAVVPVVWVVLYFATFETQASHQPGHTFDGNVLNPGYTLQAPQGRFAGVQNRPRRDPISAFFELRPGDRYTDGTPRNELYSIPTHNGVPDYIEEGDDLYIGWSMDLSKVPVSTATCWNVLTQFKQRTEAGAGGSPPVAVQISGSGDRLRFSRNLPPAQDYWSDAAASYRTPWTDFVAHVKFHRSATVGFVQLWVNGVQKTLLNGQTQMAAQTMDPGGTGRSYLKFGLYRSDTCTTTAQTVLNGVRVGPTYADAKYP